MHKSLCVTLSATFLLAACNVVATPGGEARKADTTAETSQSAPLTPAGAPVTLMAAQTSAGDDGLQWAAGVVKVDSIPGESAKLFGVAGGDPAMNGLQTYIAFFLSAGDGWAIYPIGDFLDYTVLANANGRVDLDIEESTMDEATGSIGSRHRKIIVQWTQGADEDAPSAVTVTPAQ